MKTIIAGSRRIPSMGLNRYKDWQDQTKTVEIRKILEEVIKFHGLPISNVISGKCWGIDQLGEKWAIANGIKVIDEAAKWEEYGRAAGHIRNSEMAEIGEALICICTRNSAGSLDMIKKMVGKPTTVKYLD